MVFIAQCKIKLSEQTGQFGKVSYALCLSAIVSEEYIEQK